jgi:hypothetical protein
MKWSDKRDSSFLGLLQKPFSHRQVGHAGLDTAADCQTQATGDTAATSGAIERTAVRVVLRVFVQE